MTTYAVYCDVDETTVLVDAENEAEARSIVADKTIELFDIPAFIVRPMQDHVFHATEATAEQLEGNLTVNDAEDEVAYLTRTIDHGVLSELVEGLA